MAAKIRTSDFLVIFLIELPKSGRTVYNQNIIPVLLKSGRTLGRDQVPWNAWVFNVVLAIIISLFSGVPANGGDLPTFTRLNSCSDLLFPSSPPMGMNVDPEQLEYPDFVAWIGAFKQNNPSVDVTEIGQSSGYVFKETNLWFWYTVQEVAKKPIYAMTHKPRGEVLGQIIFVSGQHSTEAASPVLLSNILNFYLFLTMNWRNEFVKTTSFESSQL